MHDLRHDQEAEDAATHARLRCNTTWYAGSDTASQRLTPAAAFAELRREFSDVFDAMPDPAVCASKAAGLRGTSLEMSMHYAERRHNQEADTSSTRLVDAVQALRLEFDVLREELRAGRL